MILTGWESWGDMLERIKHVSPAYPQMCWSVLGGGAIVTQAHTGTDGSDQISPTEGVTRWFSPKVQNRKWWVVIW